MKLILTVILILILVGVVTFFVSYTILKPVFRWFLKDYE